MNPTFSRTLFLVAVLCVSFTAAQAAEVRLTDGQLIVAGVDDSIGLGAFDVVLSYGSDVSITSVEGLSGFLVVENMQNNKGMTVIVGISAEGLTGDIPVASVKVEGTGPITISVRDLGNTRGDPIPFANPEFSGTIPTPGSSTSGSGSVTPASTQASMPTKTAVPAGTPQLTETESKPILTTEATTMPTQVPLVESQGAPERGVETEGTPKAVLPALLALSAVLIVMVLKRKG